MFWVTFPRDEAVECIREFNLLSSLLWSAWTPELLSVDVISDTGARDLVACVLAGSITFDIGWFSTTSNLTLFLVEAPLSLDKYLLTGGVGDFGFPERASLSSGTVGIFGDISLPMSAEENFDLLCLAAKTVLA